MDNRITQLISAVEKNIESRQYSLALEQLTAAEEFEPNNKSIKMIRDLVRSLQSDHTAQSQSSRFLSVTIDPKSPTGVKQTTSEPVTDVRTRIRSLTSSAQYFLTRGAVDNAFESLMRAYLLDPVAPEVLACEKSVLPAWQNLHGVSPAGGREWNPDLIPHRSNASSSLFERLKSGKLFR